MARNNEMMRPEELLLDPHNPRIHPSKEHSHEQRDVARKLGRQHSVRELVIAINNGSFRAPEPLLAMQDGPHTVVIDGNRRLLAITVGRNPKLAADLELDKNLPPLNAAAEGDTNRIPVAIFEDPLELHAVRVTRQVMSVSGWRSTVTARDYHRLLQAGVPMETIGSWYHIHPDIVRHRVEAHLAFEQVNRQPERTRLTSNHHGLWTEALQRDPIRKALGLPTGRPKAAPEETPPADPIPARNLGDALQLATLIAGDGKRRRAVESSRELDSLAAIYGDTERLRLLIERPNTTARELADERTGLHRTATAETTAKRVHGFAVHLLAEIKEDHPEEGPQNADVQVADTQFRLHQDGAASYAIILTTARPEQNGAYAARLQERLQSHDPPCLVEMR